jgi:hypothetical protein
MASVNTEPLRGIKICAPMETAYSESFICLLRHELLHGSWFIL